MTREYIDLHIHTKASDGIFTPAQVVEVVMKLGLKAFSITDHDTINGFVEAEKLIIGNNIEVVPGVELSCHYKESDVHILGYYIDFTNPEFEKKINKFRQERYERGEEMVSRLNENSPDDRSMAAPGTARRPPRTTVRAIAGHSRIFDMPFLSSLPW